MGDQNNIAMTLRGLGIEYYFHSTTGGHEVVKGKPDLEIFLKAAQKTGVDPIDCLAFEDTKSGITSAKTAGMNVIGVSTQFSSNELRQLGCIEAISSFDELSFH